MVRRAAEAGIGGAWKLMERTPRELEMELRAHAARRQATMEEMDLQAWLAGRYAMLAMHAPKRYPRRPDAVRRRPARMSDGEMKQVFAALAAGRGGEDGGC